MSREMVLVTGGTGYIGSHTVVQLQNAGFPVVIFDNLCNSKSCVIERIQRITNQRPDFIKGDIRDRSAVQAVFQAYPIKSVIHFAGLKAVGESEVEPLKYYNNNVLGSIVLFEEMAKANVNTLIFSSSATVYGDTGRAQFHEDAPVAPVNVYGRTKLMIEDILRDLKKAQPSWRIALLRYFNPVGAHKSGLIGEDPLGIPNNLLPLISQVAVGKKAKLSVFGNDYPTPDGTGLRDYIHVEDLASGHLAALKVLNQDPSLITLNLGTGRPYSVLEMIEVFEKTAGRQIPYEIVARRAGDIAAGYADPSLAKTILNWTAEYGIERMCQDAWRWQNNSAELQ